MSDWILASTAVLIIALLMWLLDASRRRSSLRGLRGVAFVAMVALPGLWTLGMLVHADGQMRSTGFCLSCHEMAPYGESLSSGDGDALARQHYGNGWVDAEKACYVCHTSPGVSGFVDAKLTGLHDVRVHYMGTVPDTIRLVDPYPNDICLSCHGGEPVFEDSPGHRYPETLRDDLTQDRTSCLECHGPGH